MNGRAERLAFVIRRALRRLPDLAQNLLLALLTTLVAGTSAEAVARLLESGRPPTRPVADYITRWGEGESEFYTIKSAATGWPPWEDYNSEGVRDREHAVEKPPGVRRVICLGDSVTLGTGLAAEDAYPQRLQDRLDALGEPVEILNVALGGWATREERLAYERIARKYHPDLVLLGVCLNDIPELHNNLARPPRWLQALFLRSALVRRAVGARQREIHDIEELFAHGDTPQVRQAFRTFFGEVEALRREVEGDGARLALLVFPFRGEMPETAPPPTVEEEIASFCRQRGLGFIDLRAPLREVGAGAFSDHVHLTAEGTARVAEALAGSGLFPEGPARPKAGVALRGDRQPDVPALLSLLQARAAEDRAAAAHALGNAGRDPAHGIPALTHALFDASPRVRAAAAWGLAGFGEEAAPAVRPLVGALADPHATVRAAAARALGKVGPAARDTAARALVRALTDTDAGVRRRAGEALIRVGPDGEDGRAALAVIVASRGSEERAAAAWALGTLGPAARPAVAALSDALNDPRSDVRGRAAWALGRIGPEARPAVAALAERIDDPAVGWRAIDALGGIGAAAADAVPRLARALHDPSGSIRWRAAQALGEMGRAGHPAGPDLLGALGDDDGNVRVAAARAAVRVEADAALLLPALARALHDPDSRVRAAAAHGLGRSGPAAHAHWKALVAAARDPDALVRLAVTRALHQVGPAEAQALLADLARHDPDEAVRAEARRTQRSGLRAAH